MGMPSLAVIADQVASGEKKGPRIFRPKTDTAFLGTPVVQVNRTRCRFAGTAAILCLWLFLGSATKSLAPGLPSVGGMIF